MTDPTISTLTFIGLVFASVAGARILLRAALVLSLALQELAGGRETPLAGPQPLISLPIAA
jgi:hypothetical protein